MALETVEKSIEEGFRNANENPTEFGDAKHGVYDHPNVGLLQPSMKHWTMQRQTMDKRKGDKGMVTFVVQAPTGPMACRLVAEQVDAINEPFIRRERKNAKQKD